MKTFNKKEEGKWRKEKHIRTCPYHVQLEKSGYWECAWCELPLKNTTAFKTIKGFVSPPEYILGTGKFKGVREIKKDIDAKEKHL